MAYPQSTEGEPEKKAEEKNDSGFKEEFLEKASVQVLQEHKVGEEHIKPWRATKRSYLKLYINQRKKPKKVGDTLMFSTHQTILAALYKDRQFAEWAGREEEDIDRAEEVNATCEFDYDQMGKAQHDYGKTFDFTGFGIALEDWSHFDRDSLSPIPDLWDPLKFWYDPKAASINGNALGHGACRFIYRDIGKQMSDRRTTAGTSASTSSNPQRALSHQKQRSTSRHGPLHAERTRALPAKRERSGEADSGLHLD